MIDYEKCVSCGKCVDYCKLGTYTLEEKDGKKKPVVKNPYNCVVLCNGCDAICLAGAITHQSKKERELIREIKKSQTSKNEQGQAHEGRSRQN
jgi:NAD-dependent dihydropyrimidine dehydrogenase PreA subunit